VTHYPHPPGAIPNTILGNITVKKSVQHRDTADIPNHTFSGSLVRLKGAIFQCVGQGVDASNEKHEHNDSNVVVLFPPCRCWSNSILLSVSWTALDQSEPAGLLTLHAQ